MAPNKASWIDRITVTVAGGFLVYVLAAPPIIMAIARQRGTLMGMPTIYQPVFDLIESDFGGPLLWYFNDVWGAGIILIGNESGPLLPVILAYTVAGVVVLGALAFPFLQKNRHRPKMPNTG